RRAAEAFSHRSARRRAADDGSTERAGPSAGAPSAGGHMALTGDLGSIDLANVFQMLQLSQKSGTLEIRSRGARTEGYLDGESILYPFDRDSFPAKVLRLVMRAGPIPDEAIQKARSSTTVLKRDLLSVLVGMHAVTEDVVANAFREQMEEEVYELFADRDATFEFRENEEPRGHGKVIDARY